MTVLATALRCALTLALWAGCVLVGLPALR